LKLPLSWTPFAQAISALSQSYAWLIAIHEFDPRFLKGPPYRSGQMA
jgi:hypothetical protein